MKPEHATLRSHGDHAPVLRSIDASGRLEGLLLSMTLRQVFCNDSPENLEVVYTFPLPWAAVLLGLEATLGERRMSGQVMARGDARERYEEAVEDGDAPIMVEQLRPGLFSVALGSLKSGEQAVIELRHAQLLAFEQGRIRVQVPTTIAPRYGDPVREGGLQPDQWAEPSLLAEHGFRLAITLAGPVGRARIASPSHAIAQQRVGDAVEVRLQGQAWLDRDFVLLLDALEGQSLAVAGPDARSGAGHVAVISSYCPALATAAPAPLRLKVLVDCSGSMAGDSIAQARAALRALAVQLTPQDQFSYTRFGGRTAPLLDPMPATPRNVHTLLAAIDATEADLGGTKLAQALQQTFDQATGWATAAGEADVLLITDGEVWDAQRIVDGARRSGHRIHALGVGSAPAESLLREMTEASGGGCELATPNEDMTGAIGRLLTRAHQTRPVQVRLDGPDEPLWCSPLPQRLLAGETVHVCMTLPQRPVQPPGLQLAGQVARPHELDWRDDDLVARLVAARRASLAPQPAQARAIAERYQLVTEATSLLLVLARSDEERTDGMPALHQVRPMLAAGWGGAGRIARAVLPSGDLLLPSVSMVSRAEAQARMAQLASCDYVDIDVPNFMRRSTGPHVDETPGPALRAGATDAEIVAAFNLAVAQGRGFWRALRRVTALPLDDLLRKRIRQAARQLGSRLDAWACHLLRLHETGEAALRLTPAALALVLDRVQAIEPRRREAA